MRSRGRRLPFRDHPPTPFHCCPARTEENVATASPSVPPAVADKAIVGQPVIRRDDQRLHHARAVPVEPVITSPVSS
jgi:hypothetical protein